MSTEAPLLPPLPKAAMRAAPVGNEAWTFPKVDYFTAEQLNAHATEAIRPYVEALRDLLGWFPGPSAWNTEFPTKAAERARALLSSSPASKESA